ncbi:MAG: chemotaxis protein CheD [Vulcanimicrobiota bacterium]
MLYLKPGELFICKKPTVMRTILGSCISITMHDPLTKLSAICHAVLPEMPDKSSLVPPGIHEEIFGKMLTNHTFKYAQPTIEYMSDLYERFKIPFKRLEVKLFGGADVLENTLQHDTTVGTKNINASISVLKGRGILLKARDTGGSQGRKLVFKTGTGEVFVKKIRKTVIYTHI